jgi:hypothetical protein
LFFLANSYKLVHQGKTIIVKNLGPGGIERKPLEIDSSVEISQQQVATL